MADVVQYLNLASAGSAALALLVGLLFIKAPSGWVRGFFVGVALLALVAPIYHLRNTLGLPSPWMEEGVYRLLGWKTDEAAGQIYFLVTHRRYDSPREFQYPFSLELALSLQEIRAKRDVEEFVCMKYDPAATDKPPIELRSIQSPEFDIYAGCDTRWVEDKRPAGAQ